MNEKRIASPVTIDGVRVKNRIAVPPMVNFGNSGADGIVSEKSLRHYENCARGGSGLVIVEAAAVSPFARLDDSQMGIWSDAQIEGLKKLAAVISGNGAVPVIQLHFAGLNTRAKTAVFVSPSADEATGAREMTNGEVKEAVELFTAAAGRAKTAGFSGVEIHGAHNYLLARFFDPRSNLRTDEYGGSLENRTRIAGEILAAVKARCGENFIIGIRCGSNIPDIAGGIETGKQLEAMGYGYLHISSGINDKLTELPPAGFMGNSMLYGGTKIKENVEIPVIAVNGIKTKKEAEYIIENLLADIVAVGRATISDYDWAKKVLSEE